MEEPYTMEQRVLSDALGSSTFNVHSIACANVTHEFYGKDVEYKVQSISCFHCLKRFQKTLSGGEYHRLQCVVHFDEWW